MQTGALSIRENGKLSIKSIERSLYFFQLAQAKWHDAVPFSKEKKSSTSPKRGINFSKKLLKSKEFQASVSMKGMTMDNPLNLRCPQSDPPSTPRPDTSRCPACGVAVEIWTDEKIGRCRSCGLIFAKEKNTLSVDGQRPQKSMDRALTELMTRAIRAGATDAAVVDTAEIVVEDHLAELCLPPKCPNFGTSAGCPPHVGGPAQMRRRIEAAASGRAIVIKIEIPSSTLLSDIETRCEIFALLSEIAADIEETAVWMGYTEASAYAGGGCKQTFCREHTACRVIEEDGTCRHPHKARPSMSGFGVNVGRLMQSAGWEAATSGQKAAGDDPFPICALVIVG